MAQLKNLTPGTLVQGITPDGSVEVVSVKWFGDSTIELTFKIPATGTVSNRLLYHDDETSLEVVDRETPPPPPPPGGKCPVHGAALVEKEVSVIYGMLAPDSDIFEISSRFPYHGLLSLGGCIVSPDSSETEMALVCADCHDAAEKFGSLFRS
jgi:hypothetical protein